VLDRDPRHSLNAIRSSDHDCAQCVGPVEREKRLSHPGKLSNHSH